MTAPGGADGVRTTVEVDYGQWYLFDPERLRDEIGGLIADDVSQAELWERRCASTGGVAIVYTLKQYGHTPVEARVVPVRRRSTGLTTSPSSAWSSPAAGSRCPAGRAP